MTMNDLTQAIDRSRSHNEIVAVEFSGNHADLLVALDELWEGDIDSVVENDGTVDVWDCGSSSGEADMDWRLSVTLH